MRQYWCILWFMRSTSGKKKGGGGLLEVILGTVVPLEIETPCPFIYSLSMKSIPIQFVVLQKFLVPRKDLAQEIFKISIAIWDTVWKFTGTQTNFYSPHHLRFAFYFNYKILWLPRITILITWPYGLL